MNGKIKREVKIEDEFNAKEVGVCLMKCNRESIITISGSVIVCHGCMRILIDNRQRNEYSK